MIHVDMCSLYVKGFTNRRGALLQWKKLVKELLSSIVICMNAKFYCVVNWFDCLKLPKSNRDLSKTHIMLTCILYAAYASTRKKLFHKLQTLKFKEDLL